MPSIIVALQEYIYCGRRSRDGTSGPSPRISYPRSYFRPLLPRRVIAVASIINNELDPSSRSQRERSARASSPPGQRGRGWRVQGRREEEGESPREIVRQSPACDRDAPTPYGITVPTYPHLPINGLRVWPNSHSNSLSWKSLKGGCGHYTGQLPVPGVAPFHESFVNFYARRARRSPVFRKRAFEKSWSTRPRRKRSSSMTIAATNVRNVVDRGGRRSSRSTGPLALETQPALIEFPALLCGVAPSQRTSVSKTMREPRVKGQAA